MKRFVYTEEILQELASQYAVIKDFRKDHQSAYTAIRRLGLIDKLCGHMKRMQKKPFTEEELAEIAAKYNRVKDFKQNDKPAYREMHRRGLFKKYCSHMQRLQKDPYTNEELVEIAARYDDVNGFKKNERSAYAEIQRRGLLKELCGNMKRRIRTLSNEDLAEIALKYETRTEFMKGDGSAYTTAHARGILNNICRHMKRKNARNDAYTKENCQIVAIEYNTRADFQRGNGAVYRVAKQRGWLDDICGHMSVAGSGKKRKVYAYTFDDGYAYVGLTDNINRRKQEHIGQFRKKKSAVLRHIQETGAKFEFKELTEWLDATVAGQVEDDYIKLYAAEGWKMLNRRKGGGMGSKTGVFSPNAIRNVVASYEYADEFKQQEPGIYEYLCSNHLYSKYCSELKHRRQKSGYWTLEKAVEVVPECETRTIFQKRYYQAYVTVKKAGLLDDYYPEEARTAYKWPIDKCIKIARTCNSRHELHKKYVGAYNALRKAGLLEKLIPSHKHHEKYNNGEKMKIIASCKTKRQLHDNYRSVYDWLRLTGRLDEFFPKRR